MQPETVPSTGLQFAGVRGTTAQSSAQFAVSGDKFAYVAGSGVIVATISSNGSVHNQRLFVANALTDASLQSNGYLKPSHGLEPLMNDEDLRKDSYGYPVNWTYFHNGSHAESETASTGAFDTKEASANNASAAKLKEKVRVPSCLAISPNGRVLAVGEAGYQPRILLFSLAPDSAAQPFAVVHEHSFGINHIVFSPNSKYFCSLGTISDGFLHVWKYSATSVARRAGNKCSSAVNDLLWHDTRSELGDIVTVGLRFLKVWSFDLGDSSGASPSKVAVLRGRNIVLGKLLDTNFHSAVPLSADEILVKDHANLYLLSLKTDLSIHQIGLNHSNLAGLVVDEPENALWVFDRDFASYTVDIDDLTVLPEAEAPPKTTRSPSKIALGIQNPTTASQEPTILKAHAYGNNHIVYLTSGAEIHLHHKRTRSSKALVSPPVASVSGSKRASSGELLVFSKCGKVASLTKPDSVSEIATYSPTQAGNIVNELTAVEKNTDSLFLGDKYGSLTVFDVSEEVPKATLTIKAHASTITDIVYFEVDGVPLLCSISRDRMVQIYYKANNVWDVLCTLPIHTANLLSVRFIGSYLFVCSADRSVSVHEFKKVSCGAGGGATETHSPVEIFHKKTITLKNTPLAMDVSEEEFVISSSDRSLSVYDKDTLEFKRTAKLYSDKSSEAFCVDRFLLLKNNHIAVFCSDRSLRLFHLGSGKHLTCVWGHMDSVIGLFEDDNHLLSLGVDGCLFKWRILDAAEGENPPNDHIVKQKTPVPDPDLSPLLAKVTRKFLPTVQMSKLTLSPRKQTPLPSEDTVSTEPESPTPRLTNATLKRIESRKKAQIMTSSPSRTQQPQGTVADKSPSRPKSVSPPKTQTNASPTPFNRGQTPSRPTSLSKSLHGASKAPNSISPHKAPATSLPPPITSSGDAKERSTAYVSMIKSFVKKDAFNDEDKQILKHDLEDLLALLGGPNTHEDLLQRYSDDLVSLVKKKLSD
ncbi:hypothetical protein JCM33374_g4010 [Metschnikowia sp. JCM 33374]|nr:hypothetical protein JCM33374_g4010 [Metschnikowia sp. JCM 33374]